MIYSVVQLTSDYTVLAAQKFINRLLQSLKERGGYRINVFC